jgi:SWI/SNF-related matrix-associated actin-dependent regulator of chromatin subfamily A member 5
MLVCLPLHPCLCLRAYLIYNAAVFWKRYKEIANWESYVKRIEHGESRIQRREELSSALEEKMKRYSDPWTQLRVSLTAAAESVTVSESLSLSVLLSLCLHPRPFVCIAWCIAYVLQLAYRAQRAKTAYTDADDMFLLCATHKVGYGNWEELRVCYIAPDLIAWSCTWRVSTRGLMHLAE